MTQNKLNLNDKFYLKKLTNYFSTPPFPIKYSNHTKKFFYDIYSYEKEYIFINNIFKSYGIDKFNLKKFYCQDYYDQVFQGYETDDFIFENNIYLFYGFYDGVVENFIKNNEKIEDKNEDSKIKSYLLDLLYQIIYLKFEGNTL